MHRFSNSTIFDEGWGGGGLNWFANTVIISSILILLKLTDVSVWRIFEIIPGWRYITDVRNV